MKRHFLLSKRPRKKSGKSSDLQKAERQVLELLEYTTNETLRFNSFNRDLVTTPHAVTFFTKPNKFGNFLLSIKVLFNN